MHTMEGLEEFIYLVSQETYCKFWFLFYFSSPPHNILANETYFQFIILNLISQRYFTFKYFVVVVLVLINLF